MSLQFIKLTFIYGISILLQMGEGYAWLLRGEANCGTQIKMTSFLTSTLFLLFVYEFLNSNTTFKSKFLVRLGDSSFGIYLSHIMIMRGLSCVTFYSSIPFIFNSIIVLLISFVCVEVGKKVCGKRIGKWLGLYKNICCGQVLL